MPELPPLAVSPSAQEKALWFAEAVHELGDRAPMGAIAVRVAEKAYGAGAAMELSECLTWIKGNVPRLPDGAWAENRLHEVRRPSKTLEDLAAAEIDKALESLNGAGLHGDFGNVRKLIARAKAVNNSSST